MQSRRYEPNPRARLHGSPERERIISQTNIRKPDSVLTYTCFDQFVGVAATRAPPLFSETTDFSFSRGGKNADIPMSVEGKLPDSYPAKRRLETYLGSGHSGPLMTGLALSPAAQSAATNFQHAYLGGSAVAAPIPFSSSVQYIRRMNCDQMQAVWTQAKCQNLMLLPPDKDPRPAEARNVFYTLEDLVSQTTAGTTKTPNPDPRVLPAVCVARDHDDQPLPGAATTAISRGHMALAQNKPPSYRVYTPGKITSGGYMTGSYPAVNVDGIRHLDERSKYAYFDPKLQPFTDRENGCAPLIRTGLRLWERVRTQDELGKLRSLTVSYDDGVCPNPECFHDRGVCRHISEIPSSPEPVP